MPAPNLAPILAPAPKAPNPFGHDRETGADGFALLLALLAGAPAASGGAAASPSTAGADALVASRPVDPAALPSGVGSTVAGELAAGRSGFAKLDLGRPDLDGAANNGPTGTAAAGDPSQAASAVGIAGFVPPGPGRFPDGSFLGLPSSSPASHSPSTGVPRSSPLATASLPDLPATASSEHVARPRSAPIRNLASFDDPVSGTEGAGPSIVPLAGAGHEATASPSVSAASGPLSVGEPVGLAAGALGPLVHAAGPVGPPARVSAGPLSGENGPAVSPAAPHPSRPVALPSAAGGTSRVANLPDPADRSAPVPLVQRPSQPPIEGAILADGRRRAVDTQALAAAGGGAATASGLRLGSVAGPAEAPGGRVADVGTERSVARGDPAASRPMPSGLFQGAVHVPSEAGSLGLPAGSAVLVRAGGGDPEAAVAQPLGGADPAGSPGERLAAAGSAKVAESGGRSPGGSAEADIGGGAETPTDPGAFLDLAEAGSAPVLDTPLLPEPAPMGRTAEPPVPPRLPSVPVPQPPAVQVAATLLQRDGVPIERLRIALEPAELGSVELTLTSEGRRKARAIVLVERPETLELLQRDQRTLERILVASGLELESGGLELGLRRDGEGRREALAPPSGGAGPSEPVRSGPAVTPPRLLDLRLLDLVV